MQRLYIWVLAGLFAVIFLAGLWWVQAEGAGRQLLTQVFFSDPPGACYFSGAETGCVDGVAHSACQDVREADLFLDPSGVERFVVSVFRPGVECLPEARLFIGHGQNIVSLETRDRTTAWPHCLENLEQLVQQQFSGPRLALVSPSVRHYKGWTQKEALEKLGMNVPSPPSGPGIPGGALYRATCVALVAPAFTKEVRVAPGVQNNNAQALPKKKPPLALDPVTRRNVDRLSLDEARRYLEQQLQEHPESLTRHIIDEYFREREAREKPGQKLLMQEPPIELFPPPRVVVQSPKFFPRLLFPSRLVENVCQKQAGEASAEEQKTCSYPDTFRGRFCTRLAPLKCES